MASEKQFEANRRNAQHSTGPRSPEGRAASARNSFKHGICVSDLTIATDPDSCAEVESLLDRYFDHFQPSDPDEEDALEELVTCKIRLRHLRRVENGLFNEGRRIANERQSTETEDGGRDYRFDPAGIEPERRRTVDNIHFALGWQVAEQCLERLSRYEGRIAHRYRRACERWKEIMQAREAAQSAPPDPPVEAAASRPQPSSPQPVRARGHAAPPSPEAPAQNEPNSPVTPFPGSPSAAKTPPRDAA